jgi:nicotinate-nucleotide adenylyltransferase
LTAAHHRLAMARLAFAVVPRAVVDDREIRRTGPTYTVDTLRELAAEKPGAELFLVMGEDQALAITQWREWEEVLRLATLALAQRPDAARHATLQQAGLPGQARTVKLALPSMTENATEIRRKAGQGEDISSLVPPGVAGYMAHHHLYT